MKTKLFIAIDLQNDFIDGVLGTKEATLIVPNVTKFLSELNEDDLVIFTRDTHINNESTLENKLLPLHCLKDSEGWQIHKDIFNAKKGKKEIIDKPCFGSFDLINFIKTYLNNNHLKEDDIELILFGICTDICVISNALLLRSAFIDTNITVLSSLCSATSLKNHQDSLNVMKMNLINIK